MAVADTVRMSRSSPIEELYRFRATHPLKTAVIDGVNWEYIACGQGKETLMLLPGGPGRAETAFQHILALESRYKIIAPGYPASLSKLEDMLRGLAGILAAEGVSEAQMAGGSYSGLIAQSFVRRYPKLVRSLILSDTGIPRQNRARKYGRYLRLLKALPLSAIRSIWRLGAYKYLQDITSEKEFWRAYFRQLVAGISKQECVGRLQIWIEFDRESRFTPYDLASWPGKILILEAETDATFSPMERAALRDLYPQAKTIAFKNGGHAASISNRGDYIEAMAEFLDGSE